MDGTYAGLKRMLGLRGITLSTLAKKSFNRLQILIKYVCMLYDVKLQSDLDALRQCSENDGKNIHVMAGKSQRIRDGLWSYQVQSKASWTWNTWLMLYSCSLRRWNRTQMSACAVFLPILGLERPVIYRGERHCEQNKWFILRNKPLKPWEFLK